MNFKKKKFNLKFLRKNFKETALVVKLVLKTIHKRKVVGLS